MARPELPSLGRFNIFVGPSGAGKTPFIQKHAAGEFLPEYTPTTNQKNTISFRVAGGDVDGIVYLNVFDVDSRSDVDAAIFMFNLTDSDTKAVAIQALQLFRALRPSAPAVIAGNKCDLFFPGGLADLRQIIGLQDQRPVSSKTDFEYKKSFLRLIRRLLKNSALDFGEMPAAVQSTNLPPHLLAQVTQELAAAGVAPLPDIPDIEENDFPDEPEIEAGSIDVKD